MCYYRAATFYDPPESEDCQEVIDLAFKLAGEDGREEPNEDDWNQAGETVHPYRDDEGDY